MNSRRNRNRMEMIFIIALVVLCGLLTFFQYRWTGELARAEMDRMSASLSDQAKRLCRAFDLELEHNCNALVPSATDLESGSFEAVHLKKLASWKAAKGRPIFKHIAVAVPSKRKIKLFRLDPAIDKIEPMIWPVEWSDLRENLEGKISGSSGPYEDRLGFLMEFPVIGAGRGDDDEEGRPGGFERAGKFDDPDRPFGFEDNGSPEGQSLREGPPRGGPRGPHGPAGPAGQPSGFGEREWIILELDPAYVSNVWLPELVGTYFNLGGRSMYDVTIRSKGGSDVIFLSGSGKMTGGEDVVSLNFNFHGTAESSPYGRPQEAFWVMEAGRREGALEATVIGSRRRNLAVAVVLNGLILAAGYMLLRATRNSRTLAEEQMKFVANVTHELRTPLTVIRGAAHNMKRGIVKDPAAVSNYAGLILGHAEALGEMVEQVLDFSGAQRGQFGSERQPINVREMLRMAASTAAGGSKYPDCKIEMDLPEDFPTLVGDPAALMRAFINLIENAAKHGGAGGWIGISASVMDRKVEIRVADQGPGIPADELRDIFSPFFRGGIARSFQVRGSGLGLSLVKEIVAVHGGTVTVDSETGKGSVFTVTLPLDPPKK